MSDTTKPAYLPPEVLERTREWAFQFNFGEWFDASEIQQFMRDEFGYGGTTPQQYAGRFIARGVANSDFETRLNGRQWRWKVQSATARGA